MFLVALITGIGGLFQVMTRSCVTKIIPPDELGKTSNKVSVCNKAQLLVFRKIHGLKLLKHYKLIKT